MGENLPFVNLGNNTNVTQVIAGELHTCALLSNSQIKCWGSNSFGQLGLGVDSTFKGFFPEDMGDNLDFVNLGNNITVNQVFAGLKHTCALISNHQIKCWGENGGGQLGLGDSIGFIGQEVNDMGENLDFVNLGTEDCTKTPTFSPTKNPTKNPTLITINPTNIPTTIPSYFPTKNPTVIPTENPSNNPTTMPTKNPSDNPTIVPTQNPTTVPTFNPTINPTSITPAPTNEPSIQTNAPTFYPTLSPTPTFVNCTLEVESIAFGNGDHTCALFTNQQIKCWGRNNRGQLGLGITAGSRGRNPIHMGNNLEFVNLGDNLLAIQVDAGGIHTCALLLNQQIKCWGDNDFGELGLGISTERIGRISTEMGDNLDFVNLGNNITVIQVATGGSDIGGSHTCALLSNQQIKCWGSNAFGQLGRGDSSIFIGKIPGDMGESLPFVDLGNNINATQITTGGFHTCALLSNQEIKCWGSNNNGQLGRGDSFSPIGQNSGEMGENLPFVNLGNNTKAIQVSAGREHTCALLSNYQMKCWGSNSNGQLGRGDASPTIGQGPGEMGDDLPFVDLGSNINVTQIVTGGFHTCAILSNQEIK